MILDDKIFQNVIDVKVIDRTRGTTVITKTGGVNAVIDHHIVTTSQKNTRDVKINTISISVINRIAECMTAHYHSGETNTKGK